MNNEIKFLFDKFDELHEYLADKDSLLNMQLQMTGAQGLYDHINSEHERDGEWDLIEKFKDVYDYNGFILDLKEHNDREAGGEFDI